MRIDIQKANFWKRISAFLLDIILLSIVAVGVAYAMSAIFNYDQYADMMDYAKKEVYSEYGISTDEEFNTILTDTEREEANAKYGASELARAGYIGSFRVFLLMVSMGIALAYLLLEFAIPLWLGNGQTLGKKVFGLAVIHTNGVKMSGKAHFIRSVIGKCAIEAMIPAYLIIMQFFNFLSIGLIIVILLAVLQLVCLIATIRYSRSAIHDLLSDTVVVDMESQEIFDSYDALIAYKNKLHEEEAAKKEY